MSYDALVAAAESREQEVLSVFQRFDTDKSKTIEMKEVRIGTAGSAGRAHKDSHVCDVHR